MTSISVFKIFFVGQVNFALSVRNISDLFFWRQANSEQLIMAFKIKVSFFQNPEKNEDMKLKERLVAATFGFSVAIILVFVLESLDLTDNQDYGQDQSHGIIKSSAAPKSSSVKVLFFIIAIHFEICNTKDGICLQYTQTNTRLFVLNIGL